jgi:hypothetical protein
MISRKQYHKLPTFMWRGRKYHVIPKLSLFRRLKDSFQVMTNKAIACEVLIDKKRKIHK